MGRKDRIDAFGAVSLILFSALLGFNQVVIKVVNEGLQPVFFAGIRSAGAVICVGLWMRWRGISLRPKPGTYLLGMLIGLFFSSEFLLLFTALDLTTVARSSVIFYSMPIWMALGAHVFLPGQRLTATMTVGLTVAFLGVAWAILDRPSGGEVSLAGDLCALGAAFAWAAIGLLARGSALRQENPEMQLLWQVAISAVVLTLAAPLFGPLIRDLQPLHLWGLAFQIVIVVSAGFVFWLWLLSIYPAASVAAYSFLGPIFGVGFGWLLLGERIGPAILGALALVASGLWLMNRPPRQVPQKV
jgi:drug/metabolite transporter (DMT)-like permease